MIHDRALNLFGHDHFENRLKDDHSRKKYFKNQKNIFPYHFLPMMRINVSGSARYVFKFPLRIALPGMYLELNACSQGLRCVDAPNLPPFSLDQKTTNILEGLFHPLRVNEIDPIFKEFKINFLI